MGNEANSPIEVPEVPPSEAPAIAIATDGARPAATTSTGLGWPEAVMAEDQPPIPGVATGLGWPRSVVSRETPDESSDQ